MKIFTLFLAACAFAACAGRSGSPDQVSAPAEPENSAAASEITESITLIAAGDNLIHDIIYNAARVPGVPPEDEGAFNFDPCYEHIKPLIEEADIAFVNQETVMGGQGFRNSGYPSFNTPQDAGRALVRAGFDVVNHASNHVLDAGEGALLGTMDFWDSYAGRVLRLGVFKTQEERETKKSILERKGVKFGFLSYTYGLNGYRLPQDKPWMAALIDKEVMAREIDALRPFCDILVVSMHWGSEFSHDVSGGQRDLAQFMAEHEVDLILGHHPHMTEPVEVFPRPGGGTLTCYFSLGDLLSHTQSDFSPDTILGGMAFVTVKKTVSPEGTMTAAIESAGVIPTVCHYTRGWRAPFTVYPLWDYTGELASVHYKENMTLQYLDEVSEKIFGPRVLRRSPFDEGGSSKN